MLKLSILLCVERIRCAPAGGASGDRGRFRRPRLPVRVRRDAARAAHALPHARDAAARRAGRRAQRRAHPARHRRQRRAVHPAPTSPASCSAPASRSTPRATSSSCPTTSATAGRASRATACARSFPRYGYVDMVEAAAPAAHRGPRRQSSAPGHGHVDGRHAHLALGRALSRLHGRAAAARQPADADLRPQPRLAPRRHRRDPQRSASGRTATTRRSRRACAPRRRCCCSCRSNPVLRQKQAPTLRRRGPRDR